MDKNLGGLIISEIVSGMVHLRSLDICHGDLKPENVLVNISAARLTFRICDFGASRVVRPGHLVGTQSGVTRGFFAPEVVLSDSHW
jgi:serine/threonine protein kinase